MGNIVRKPNAPSSPPPKRKKNEPSFHNIKELIRLHKIKPLPNSVPNPVTVPKPPIVVSNKLPRKHDVANGVTHPLASAATDFRW